VFVFENLATLNSFRLSRLNPTTVEKIKLPMARTLYLDRKTNTTTSVESLAQNSNLGGRSNKREPVGYSLFSHGVKSII
jgi:hypothetical protein